MDARKAIALATQTEPSLEPEDRSSRWYLLEVEIDSEAETAIDWILTASLLESLPGICYSTQCEASAIAEALAEFAHLGDCEHSLSVRLLVKHLLKSR